MDVETLPLDTNDDLWTHAILAILVERHQVSVHTCSMAQNDGPKLAMDSGN